MILQHPSTPPFFGGWYVTNSVSSKAASCNVRHLWYGKSWGDTNGKISKDVWGFRAWKVKAHRQQDQNWHVHSSIFSNILKLPPSALKLIRTQLETSFCRWVLGTAPSQSFSRHLYHLSFLQKGHMTYKSESQGISTSNVQTMFTLQLAHFSFRSHPNNSLQQCLSPTPLPCSSRNPSPWIHRESTLQGGFNSPSPATSLEAAVERFAADHLWTMTRCCSLDLKSVQQTGNRRFPNLTCHLLTLEI